MCRGEAAVFIVTTIYCRFFGFVNVACFVVRLSAGPISFCERCLVCGGIKCKLMWLNMQFSLVFLCVCLFICFCCFFANLPCLVKNPQSLDVFGDFYLSAVTAHGKFSSQAHGWAAWTVCERNYCGTSRFTGFIFIP